MDVETEKTIDEVIIETKRAVEQKADALFLMTTADYSIEKFLNIAREVKTYLPKDMMFIANIGDFDSSVAWQLKDVGFTGVYHIVRLDEGISTDLQVEQRIKTLDAIKDAGLDLMTGDN